MIVTIVRLFLSLFCCRQFEFHLLSAVYSFDEYKTAPRNIIIIIVINKKNKKQKSNAQSECSRLNEAIYSF